MWARTRVKRCAEQATFRLFSTICLPDTEISYAGVLSSWVTLEIATRFSARLACTEPQGCHALRSLCLCRGIGNRTAEILREQRLRFYLTPERNARSGLRKSRIFELMLDLR